jgi:hypothetical protein
LKRNLTGVAAAVLLLCAGCGGEPPAADRGEEPAPGATQAATPRTGGSAATPAAEPVGSTGGEASARPGGPPKVDEGKFKTTPSGLKVAVLKPGRGPAAEHQVVTVHYTGWLENGEKFDSSVDRQDPVQFELGHGGVIKGWEEGVKGMKVGEKRRLVIPPDLGYGPAARGKIPPNSTLIFDVELLEMGEAHHH